MSRVSFFIYLKTFPYSVGTLVLPLCYRLSEPQNVEQGISNIKGITSSFCGSLFCCSIFSTKKKRREGSMGIMIAQTGG